MRRSLVFPAVILLAIALIGVLWWSSFGAPGIVYVAAIAFLFIIIYLSNRAASMRRRPRLTSHHQSTLPPDADLGSDARRQALSRFTRGRYGHRGNRPVI